jgi:hypothetical protein
MFKATQQDYTLFGDEAFNDLLNDDRRQQGFEKSENSRSTIPDF